MAAGIVVPNILPLSSGLSSVIQYSTTPIAATQSESTAGPWNPPQWAVEAQTILTATDSAGNVTVYALENPSAMHLVHERHLHKTQHPVLTGANITDHAYIEPARLTLEILASDAMASCASGIWSGWETLGISVWQIFKQLQLNRTLLTVTTRLDVYANMLVVSCHSADENKTQHGLRATITLEEVLAASATSLAPDVSARPQTTNASPQGTVQSTVPPAALIASHTITPAPGLPNNIPGAGSISSNNNGQTLQLWGVD